MARGSHRRDRLTAQRPGLAAVGRSATIDLVPLLLHTQPGVAGGVVHVWLQHQEQDRSS